MKHDTKINARQEAILAFLRQRTTATRADVEATLRGQGEQVSRITVVRDLAALIAARLVEPQGGGRATVYRLIVTHPLCVPMDMRAYFAVPLDAREGLFVFQQSLFERLHDFYPADESALWEKARTVFQKQTTAVRPMTYRREMERFLIDLAWKSSQIEGNTYDLLETETLIKERIEARGHSHEEAQMILNHTAAFAVMREKPAAYRRLTVARVHALHALLIDGMHVPFGIRRDRVRITGTRYTPPSGTAKLAAFLDDVVRAINAAPFPPDKALIAAGMIAYLQPFVDGNKRTARMLANALLLAYGYPPLSYRTVDVTEYRKAMILVYEQQNFFHLKRIMMEQCAFAMEQYFQS